MLIHGVQGPWRMKCKELIQNLFSKFENIQIFLQTPIGIIPYFIEDLNPFSHINGPDDIWDYNEDDLKLKYNSLTTIHGLTTPKIKN